MAASTPTPETWKDVRALFDFLVVEVIEPLAMLKPDEVEVDDKVSGGVADDGEHDASKDHEFEGLQRSVNL